MKEFKVIAIPNNKTILIDYGFNQHAKKGDTLRIITRGKPLIVNGINYGSYDAVKAIIEVTVPYEKFSECKIFSYSQVNVLSPLENLVNKTIKKSLEIPIQHSDSNIITPPPITPVQVDDIVILTNE